LNIGGSREWITILVAPENNFLQEGKVVWVIQIVTSPCMQLLSGIDDLEMPDGVREFGSIADVREQSILRYDKTLDSGRQCKLGQCMLNVESKSAARVSRYGVLEASA